MRQAAIAYAVVQFNYLCALSMAIHSLYFAGGIATPLGATSAIFGAFCAFNGISSQMNKYYGK